MLNNLMSKVMGSSLTKNYEVEKDPYMHGGLHNLWKIYRAKKKDRNNMDCSLFIFDKKSLEKKKLSQAQKDEIYNILKKDPQNLAKLKHPNLISLVEQPLEDQKYIIFATDPIEYNLSSLVFDATKKELIPGDLEIKCLCLELLEALNFLHSTAKNMHMGLAPEHIYITKDGKLKLGGLNFAQQFSTADSLHVPLNYDLKVNDLALVPNMRFAAPELSESQQCSFNSDLFSVGCLIYFMVALNKGKDPFILNQKDITDKSQHSQEVKQLERKFANMFAGFEHDFETLMRQLLNINHPESRGPLNEIVGKSWFQDPLLKTIKYLETLDNKDHQNKVQFLTGITLILQKFDKKALLKKVVPLLLDQMKVIQLSVNVLPSLIDIMDRQNYLTTTEFREYIWPSLQKLCKAKELPAQSLYIILKNTELFMKFVGPSEFQQNFLILINKSLECGVPKLQFLALQKVPIMIKQLDYQVVKQQILPRVLMILEKPSQVQLKQKTLEILNDVIPGIDSQTMKDKILKTFEKVRSTETDPQVCMLMLKIYEQMAKTLGVEEIGLKILPGIIPMLISGTFTRVQFTEMMLSVRRLLDQIEKHKEKDLRDMGQEISPAEKLEVDEKANKVASISNPTNKDVFDFLGSLDIGGSFGNAPKPSNNDIPNPLANTGGASLQYNLMAGFTGLNIGSTQSTTNPLQSSMNKDPFADIMGSSSTNTQTQQKPVIGGGWESDMPIISDINKPSQNHGSDSFFNNISAQSKPVQQQDNNWGNFGGQTQNSRSSFPTQIQNNNNTFGNTFGFNQNQGLNNMGSGNTFGGSTFSNKNDDPFAELINDQNASTGIVISSGGGNTFGNQFGGANTFGNNQQQNVNTQQNNNWNFGTNFGNQPQQNMNSFGTFGTQNNNINQNQNLGGLNLQKSSQQNNINTNNNLLGGLNFGNTNTMNNNNNMGGLNFNANLGLGNQNQQQNKNNNLGGLNDDFFSQFTNGNQQQKPQNMNNFGF